MSWIDRSPAGKLSITGPDALAYLQAHLTADLRPLAVGHGTPTALLAPKGQIRALGRVLRFGGGYLLHCERPALEGLFRGLWHGRIGWQVEIHKLTLAQDLVTAIARAGRPDPAEHLGLALPATPLAHVATALDGVPVRAVRTWAGVDLIPRADHGAAVRAALTERGLEPATPAAWDRLRVTHGRLLYGTDATDTTLPAEAAIAEALLTKDKGLYPGLQTVLRQDRSGTVHRHLCRLASAGPLAAGDELVGEDGAVLGTVTTGVAGDGGAFVGIGRLRRADHGALRSTATDAAVRATPLADTAPSL